MCSVTQRPRPPKKGSTAAKFGEKRETGDCMAVPCSVAATAGRHEREGEPVCSHASERVPGWGGVR